MITTATAAHGEQQQGRKEHTKDSRGTLWVEISHCTQRLKTLSTLSCSQFGMCINFYRSKILCIKKYFPGMQTACL
jgi:hypothetical protein